MHTLDFELEPFRMLDVCGIVKFLNINSIQFDEPQKWTLVVEPEVTITLWPMAKKCRIESKTDQLPDRILMFKSLIEYVPDPQVHIIDGRYTTDKDVGNA